MKNRTPVPRDRRAPLPAFTPVPRKARHDGWTPERQKAFIEALADTGSVSRACAMVNMTTVGAYYLRRQPQADEFRRAWEAALDYGVARMKDIAFERAVEGTLSPVITGGKLIGWRRIYNDRLLMFCLRHYGQDENGRRTRVEYFSTRASAGTSGAPSVATPARSAAGAARRDAGPGRPTTGNAGSIDVTDSLRDAAAAPATAHAEASTTTVRTIIAAHAAPEDLAASLGSTAAALDAFDGVRLDARAEAEIRAVLEQCAARQRAVEGSADDEAEPFVAAIQPPREMLVYDEGYKHPRRETRRPPPVHDIVADPEDLLLPSPHELIQPEDQHRSGDGEMDWRMLDDEDGMRTIEEVVESMKQAKLEAPSDDG
jgi:hypothetical protein